MQYLQAVIPSTPIVIDVPFIGATGIFAKGVFSGLALLLEIFLSILVVVWVAIGIYAAYRIVSSLGDTQKIEAGIKYIKSVFWGITYLLAFFGILGVVTAFLGVGFPWEWSENLVQCRFDGYAPGRFYFQGKQFEDPDNPGEFRTLSVIDQIDEFYPNLNSTLTAYCCEEEVDGDTFSYVEVGTIVTIDTCSPNSIVRGACLETNRQCVVGGGTPCCSGVCDREPNKPFGYCR